MPSSKYIVILLVITLVSINSFADVYLGKWLEDINGYTINGEIITNILKRNAPSFILFTKSDCKWCDLLMTDFIHLLQNELHKPNLVVIGIGDPIKLQNVTNELSKVCSKVELVHDQNKDIFGLYEITYVPFLLYIDENNLITWIYDYSKESSFENQMETLLNDK